MDKLCTAMQRKKSSNRSHLEQRRKRKKMTHALTVTTKLTVIADEVPAREHQKEGLPQTCSQKKAHFIITSIKQKKLS